MSDEPWKFFAYTGLSHFKLENKKISVPNDAIYGDRDLGQHWPR